MMGGQYEYIGVHFIYLLLLLLNLIPFCVFTSIYPLLLGRGGGDLKPEEKYLDWGHKFRQLFPKIHLNVNINQIARIYPDAFLPSPPPTHAIPPPPSRHEDVLFPPALSQNN